MSVAEIVEDEVIAALEGAAEPMGRSEIFDECPTATSADQISRCLNRLLKDGLVEKMGGGKWSHVPDGIPQPKWPAPASASAKVSATDIPSLGDRRPPAQDNDEDPLIAAVRSLPVPEPFPDAERSAAVLRKLAEWPAMHPELADKLNEIAAEINRRAA